MDFAQLTRLLHMLKAYHNTQNPVWEEKYSY